MSYDVLFVRPASRTDLLDEARQLAISEFEEETETAPSAELLSNVVDEVVSQAATLGRMTPSWNLVSLATSTRCFAASRVRQW